MAPEIRKRQIARRLALLTLLAVLAAAAFLLLNARGSWDFLLPFRGRKLAALAVVAVAIALSTVVFQTVTQNRILTPAIMGFDALYVLIQTGLVFGLGAGRVSALDARLVFGLELGAMVLFALLLFRWMFGPAARNLHLLMLVGIVLGTLFRSISGFLQRIIDPDSFTVLQDRLFASFNAVDPGLLTLSALIVAGLALVLWRLVPELDVLALGREAAIGLGVPQERLVLGLLVIVTMLVALSTALVGPVTFLGLLVANLAYLLMPTARHAVLLPAAALIALITLIGGQTLLERVLHYDTALAVVVEFAGGLVFILLVIRGVAR
ncbi:iron chelate uptake ABC transporter family permease subunit [Pararhodobacter aggregans]|uniref:Enterobactin ABC transporter permease n=1 Tax=Pararhodobacter aggregans TaxID=404875 RepID=A0A2T7UQE1_9RHOB|nr:iron chelate uptake ABC transporter family permease subunit [Pararhodobacter aggregans]PTX01545.1 iron complex transport system permease protein [Pararhodobacter aggregans]PVE46811.1 enterobactin ABC transporter permease [Pararhodobacter aggregans]